MAVKVTPQNPEGNQQQQDDITDEQIAEIIENDKDLKSVVDVRRAFGGESAAQDAIGEIKKNIKGVTRSIAAATSTKKAEPAGEPGDAIKKPAAAAKDAGPDEDDDEEEEDDEKSSTTDEDDNPLKDINSPFLKDFKLPKTASKGKKKDTGSDLDAELDTIEVPDEVNNVLRPFLAKHLGMDAKKADLKMLLKTSVEHRKKASAATDTEKKLTEQKDAAEQDRDFWKSMIEQAPPSLVGPLKTFFEGGDYRKQALEMLDGPDPNKSFDDQDLKKMVMRFNKEVNITDSEADDYIDLSDKKDAGAKAIIASTKAMFGSWSKEIKNERARLEESTASFSKSLKESATGSVNKLKEEIPGVSKEDLDEVNEMLSAGSNLELKLFKKKDGNYRQDAALTILYGKKGLQEIKNLREAVERITKYYAAKIIEAPDTSKKSSKRDPQEVDKDVQKIRNWGGTANRTAGSSYSRVKVTAKGK